MLEDDERCICGLWKKKWTKLWYYFQHQLILKIVALEMVVLYRAFVAGFANRCPPWRIFIS